MNAKTQVPLIRAFIILLVLNFFGTFVIPVSSLKTPGFVVSFSRNRASLFGIHSNELEHVNVSVWQSIPRAGGSASDVEDEDETEEDEDESTLSKATQASLEKIKKEQRENVKEIIQASLPKSKKDKKKKKSSSRLSSSSITIPYIIKALLNPFTVWSMTKGYFASLFNIDYIQEDASQTLRSALQEKARQDALSGGGKRRPTRKFKPGQAKTLSDLPQLNT